MCDKQVSQLKFRNALVPKLTNILNKSPRLFSFKINYVI